MPDEHYDALPRQDLMNAREIGEIVRIFVEQGVNKIRLTGGEPLLRKDFGDIVAQIYPHCNNITFTTNAVLIDRHIDFLEELGLKQINVSLDTLRRDRFFALAKRDEFERVYQNLQNLLKRNFDVKLNAVLLPGFNEDELLDFVSWSEHDRIRIRFIEFMPFSGNHWDIKKLIPYEELIRRVQERFEIEKIQDAPNDTSRNWKIKGAKGSFGFIASMTAPFCETCNRLRLTADGKLRNCLFSNDEFPLLDRLRAGEDILAVIQQALDAKHARHAGIDQIEVLGKQGLSEKSMIQIGG
jgi:cyclic pyranopterin phosphate synthase